MVAIPLASPARTSQCLAAADFPVLGCLYPRCFVRVHSLHRCADARSTNWRSRDPVEQTGLRRPGHSGGVPVPDGRGRTSRSASEGPRLEGSARAGGAPYEVTRPGPQACGRLPAVPPRDERAGAIGAVVARFVHTEEVTGSNPVSPTDEPVRRGTERSVRTPSCVLDGRPSRPSWSVDHLRDVGPDHRLRRSARLFRLWRDG